MWLWMVAWAGAIGADVRGMTVSCPTWGWEWGSDAMVETLDVLASDGINWVAIHPYATIRRDGTVSTRPFEPAAPPDWLARPIQEAHARGMKVMIKPHLAYWGSGFSWRGAITFRDEAHWLRFFATYEAWVVQLAQASAGADAYAVGTELDKTIHRDEWRRVITSVEAVYSGPLTYAANWDRVGDVPFWDALDVVGVQAYFPVVEGPAGRVPTAAELAAGWARIMTDVRGLHERTGKHVLFTELGYDASATAATKPWASDGAGRNGQEIQHACMRAALRAIDVEPAVVGAFLWKWFPGEVQRGDFRMSGPGVRALIREAWGSPPSPASDR